MMNFNVWRVLLCTTLASRAFSFDRLMALAVTIFEQDPLSIDLFVFLNRSGDRMAIMYGDCNGFYTTYRRFEACVFQSPTCGLILWLLLSQHYRRRRGGLPPPVASTIVPSLEPRVGPQERAP
jgi:hypothetical protein